MVLLYAALRYKSMKLFVAAVPVYRVPYHQRRTCHNNNEMEPLDSEEVPLSRKTKMDSNTVLERPNWTHGGKIEESLPVPIFI